MATKPQDFQGHSHVFLKFNIPNDKLRDNHMTKFEYFDIP